MITIATLPYETFINERACARSRSEAIRGTHLPQQETPLTAGFLVFINL